MSCDEIDRWLDEGSPAAAEEQVRAHAATCARCAEILSVDEALEAALRAPARSAPAALTDRVMARIGRGRLAAPILMPAIPWWIRVASEPVTVLALVAGGAIVWGWQELWALAMASRDYLNSFARGAHWLPGRGDGGLALQLAVGTLLALSAGSLSRAATRLASRRH